MKAQPPFSRAGITALVAICLFPVLSYGWGNTWMGVNLERVYNNLHWRTGLLRGGGVFNLSNMGYSSDIFYGSTPEPVPDYTVAIGPNVLAMSPLGKKFVLEASAYPQYLFFLRTENERAWNAVLGSNLHVVLNRLYFLAGGEYSNTRERAGPEVDINIRRKELGMTGLALWQASKGTSFALRYHRSAFDYVDPEGLSIRENLNREESFVDLKAFLQRVARTRFSLDGEYGTYTFTADPTHLRDAQRFAIYGGIEFIPPTEGGAESRGISGTVHLGYAKLDIRDPLQKDYSGLSGSATLAVNFIRHLGLRGFFEKGAEFSVFSGVSYYVQTSFGGGLTRYFSRRVTLSYDVSLSRIDYSESGIEGQPTPENANRYILHSFRTGFQLRRNLSINLFVSLSTRSANMMIPQGRSNFFGFSLIYGISPGTTTVIANPTER
jgi:hypothetical protein